MAAITEVSMQGEIKDFNEGLTRRVELPKGLDASMLEWVYTECSQLSLGAEKMLKTVQALGIHTLLVSGGFKLFTSRLQERLGLDRMRANALGIIDGKLTGRVLGEIVNADVKVQTLKSFYQELGVSSHNAVVMGNGLNDLKTMGMAGLPVMSRAKPIVQAQADVAFNAVGLDGLLNLFPQQQAAIVTCPPARRKPAPVVRETVDTQDYTALLTEVRVRIQAAQYTALRAINKELVGLYWDIGQLVVTWQQTKDWDRAVIQQLATDLQASFPDTGGSSAPDLQQTKDPFGTCCDAAKLAPLAREIGWSHSLLIPERCKDAQECEFYLHATHKLGWSKNVLTHQIDSQSYEKSLLSQTNFDQALTPALRAQAELVVEGEYVFDLLESSDQYSEWELERALITRTEDFLCIIGGMFTLLGNQYQLEADGDEYFIDLLLLYHRLRSPVTIELEIGKFGPEFVDKVQSYLAVLNGWVRQDDENPSIGIILCKEEKRTIAGYMLRDARKPIGVTTYAITKSLPKELQSQLPSPETIARLLETLQPRLLKTGRHGQLAYLVITAF